MKKKIWVRRLAVGMLVMLLLLSLAACSGKNGAASMEAADKFYSESSMGAPKDDGMGMDYNYSAETGVAWEENAETPSLTDPEADSARKLIKKVSMNLETREFDAFIDQMYNRVSAVGGYVQSSYVDGGQYYNRYYSRSATVTVRIPADCLDLFCDGISGISNVTSRREETSDVTQKYYDTDSRMRALQSEYTTLVGILEKCTKLSDVISVQQRITEVLYQIESYKTTLNNYDNLVAYSTVTMQIQEVREETVVTEQSFGQRMTAGIRTTFADIREDFEDLLVSFVATVPYLVIWGVFVAAGVLLLRFWIRRTLKKRRARKQTREAEGKSE